MPVQIAEIRQSGYILPQFRKSFLRILTEEDGLLQLRKNRSTSGKMEGYSRRIQEDGQRLRKWQRTDREERFYHRKDIIDVKNTV